uniref:Uncharacterized protein n=1 Tax=Rhizophora mucronata TaxID=61149 RepID=A0A2P2PY71_RHIMU
MKVFFLGTLEKFFTLELLSFHMQICSITVALLDGVSFRCTGN